MRRRLLLLLVLFLTPTSLFAQIRISGRITDQGNMPIAGVRVSEKGTLNSTLTDGLGRYELRVASDAVLTFARPGFREEERATNAASVKAAGDATLDVELVTGYTVAALEVVGTRRLDRSATNTPVAVDIVDLAAVTQQSGQLDLNQLLQYVAPSFNANRQSGADGADHIDPASLRGLGPDQTLVLINGKRRHQSSLINIFGSRGRGNTGTDLNAIPVAAIDHIEILRDGASAQYGSDAIAGVINIVLKSSVGAFTGDLATGTHNAEAPSDYAVVSSGTDGAELRAGANYGVRVGEQGFLNLTGELLSRGRTNRPADPAQFDIYRRQFGDAELINGGFFLNSLVPISGTAAFYAFGGANFRDTDAYAWTRAPDDERNVPAIYPNGFDPHITSTIRDLSLSAGVRAKLGEFDLDINSTAGSNRFHYNVEGTLNTSLGAQSPRAFDAGGFSLFQSTTGSHLKRLLADVGGGLNVALGSELRYEKYSIFAGEEGSWQNYGGGGPGGAQGFPGFQPRDETDESRTNIGGYADLELDASDRLTLSVAARGEHYSDFGNTVTGKFAARLGVSDALSLRGSVSTGFRAPSLAQVYFSSTFTDVVSGDFVDKVIAPNNSSITRALGIPELTEEKSVSAGLGLTARIGELTATIDGYIVNIDDRIVLTGAFEDTDSDIGADLQRLGVSAAQFFTNALDTETRGLDVVLSHQFYAGEQRFNWSLAGNFNNMELGQIHTNAKLRGKEDIYFGAREQAFLLASAPSSKVTLTVDHNYRRFDTQLRITNFGRVTLIDWLDTRDVYQAKATTGLSIGYRMSDNTRLTIGAANLFNVYPTQQDTETETGGLWDAVQMGFAGSFYFARLSVRL
ncbi:MAG: TonB-dependent receptor [Gemmatimonadota bacterium]